MINFIPGDVVKVIDREKKSEFTVKLVEYMGKSELGHGIWNAVIMENDNFKSVKVYEPDMKLQYRDWKPGMRIKFTENMAVANIVIHTKDCYATIDEELEDDRMANVKLDNRHYDNSEPAPGQITNLYIYKLNLCKVAILLSE